MRFGILFLTLLLWGCADPTLPEMQRQTYRDPAVSILSVGRIDIDRLAGRWHVWGSYMPPSHPAVSNVVGPPIWVFEPKSGQMIGIHNGTSYPENPRPYRVVGPGRFEASGRYLVSTPVIWVLWVDADYQTMVLGAPTGHFAVVLCRGTKNTGVNLAKAEAILGSSGYDLSRFQVHKGCL